MRASLIGHSDRCSDRKRCRAEQETVPRPIVPDDFANDMGGSSGQIFGVLATFEIASCVTSRDWAVHSPTFSFTDPASSPARAAASVASELHSATFSVTDRATPPACEIMPAATDGSCGLVRIKAEHPSADQE